MNTNSKFTRNSLHSTVLGGVPCTVPNRTDEVKSGSPHWYVSYNSHDLAIYGDVTTALVLGQGEHFLILNGDHRGGFSVAMGDPRLGAGRLTRCLAYVRKHRDQLSRFSDPVI